MKKNILIFLSLLFVSFASAQKNEYRYIAIRLGFNNSFNSAPQTSANKYLYAPGYTQTTSTDMQLAPVKKLGYTPGVMASVLYHFDFANESSGIFTGVDYNYTGITSKYETTDNFNEFGRSYTLAERHRIHMVGVPLAFRFGPDLWDTQTYGYAGVRFNYIVAINSVETADWVDTPSSTKLESDEFVKTNFSFFAGVNWKFVNLQFDFYPSSLFDPNYIEDLNTNYSKYEGQVDKFFTLTLGMNIPYGWLSEQSFWWKRKLRKFPIWK